MTERFEVRGDDVNASGVISIDKSAIVSPSAATPGVITPEILQKLKDSFTRKAP